MDNKKQPRDTVTLQKTFDTCFTMWSGDVSSYVEDMDETWQDAVHMAKIGVRAAIGYECKGVSQKVQKKVFESIAVAAEEILKNGPKSSINVFIKKVGEESSKTLGVSCDIMPERLSLREKLVLSDTKIGAEP
ncbi:MAG TPA: hypothetical protein DD400_05280 [Rhodospirillaceae bacterium]|nr:hypothetical protein [Rhodospirillaceae bacterium]